MLQSLNSPNITMPPSDLTTKVSSPGPNGLTCAEREKERNRKEERRGRIRSSSEENRGLERGGGVNRK